MLTYALRLFSRVWIIGGWRRRAWKRPTELLPCLGTMMVTASSPPGSRYSSGAMTIPPTRPPPQLQALPFTSETPRRRRKASRTSAGTACGERGLRTPWRTLPSPRMGPFLPRPQKMTDLSVFGTRTSNVSHFMGKNTLFTLLFRLCTFLVLFPSGQTKEGLRSSILNSELSFSYIYLAHPRSVTGFSWRKTSKYMPR